MRIKFVAVMGVILLATVASAQTPQPDHTTMDHGAMQGSPLTSAGQDAFGAIQEVVQRLEADPHTDWSHVNIDALREHLIDMNEVVLHAVITSAPTERGIRYTVTGEGRTREAIQRMIIGHATAMGDAEHWTMTAQRTATGVVVLVAPKQPADLPRIRALGLIGMMSDGAHHQPHHWYLATGERPMDH